MLDPKPFSTSFLSYLLTNLVNCVNTQMVNKFEVAQYILFVDSDMK